MRVEVTISETNNDEREALARKLAAHPGYERVEDYFAAHIAGQVAVLAEAVHEERITAQRALGEVLVQLPGDEQAELVGRLIEKAHAYGIDTSALGGVSG